MSQSKTSKGGYYVVVVAFDGIGQVDAHPRKDPKIPSIYPPFVIRDVLQNIKKEQSQQDDAGEERNGEVAASSGKAGHTVCLLEYFNAFCTNITCLFRYKNVVRKIYLLLPLPTIEGLIQHVHLLPFSNRTKSKAFYLLP
jgi:hypothetical protein